jgi:hypothetical protein
MDAFDLEVTKTTQRIIQGEIQDASQIENILTSVSPKVRDEVVKTFRTNDKLRYLFPEKAVIFDEHNFQAS